MSRNQIIYQERLNRLTESLAEYKHALRKPCQPRRKAMLTDEMNILNGKVIMLTELLPKL